MRISLERFGVLPDGSEATLYTVTNANGYVMRCTNYGATLVGFQALDREGHADEVTLGFDDLEHYAKEHPFFGATIGRVANRVAGARFTLNGETYRLDANEGANTLHSGPNGFHNRLFGAEAFERGGQAGVLFHLVSPNGDQGFPGEVSVSVSMSLTEENEMLFEYHAESDRPTPINLTNHAYWNLAGAPDRRRHRGEQTPDPEPRGGAVGEHEVTIFGREYLEVDEESIPTGRILPVAGTPNDFTSPKPVGADIQAAGGHDLCYVLDPSMDGASGAATQTAHGFETDLHRAAMVRDPSSGRTMEVLTTSPALQFYSGVFLATAVDQFGQPFHTYDALCVETQYHPDAVNHDNFPSIILQPGETFQHKTVHRFGVE
ncbi:MAG: aldose epimerase family protein [Spirochaetota bacterium]